MIGAFIQLDPSSPSLCCTNVFMILEHFINLCSSLVAHWLLVPGDNGSNSGEVEKNFLIAFEL